MALANSVHTRPFFSAMGPKHSAMPLSMPDWSARGWDEGSRHNGSRTKDGACESLSAEFEATSDQWNFHGRAMQTLP